MDIHPEQGIATRRPGDALSQPIDRGAANDAKARPIRACPEACRAGCPASSVRRSKAGIALTSWYRIHPAGRESEWAHSVPDNRP